MVSAHCVRRTCVWTVAWQGHVRLPRFAMGGNHISLDECRPLTSPPFCDVIMPIRDLPDEIGETVS
jgi:hypothetical protein